MTCDPATISWKSAGTRTVARSSRADDINMTIRMIRRMVGVYQTKRKRPRRKTCGQLTSPFARDIEHRLRGAPAGTWCAQTGADLAEIAANRGGVRRIGQHAKGLVGDTLRRELVLDQLR